MSNINIRDPQHAARLFVDDHFRLAPKHKFLFHVAFSINPSACKNINIIQRHRNEINMLVKSVDLPHYSVKTETLNQYNRKKNVQYTHEYNAINIVFHDDNMSLINQVWQNYYNYYYADPSSAADPGAYNRNAMKNFNYIKNAYGLDNGSKLPFFNYIKIYQMARREFVSYKLYNPIITDWNHNKVAYADDNNHDFTMQLRFEAVEYDMGKVEKGNPEGFGSEHYDQTPSPLKGGKGEGGSGSQLTTAGSASPSFTNKSSVNPREVINNLTTSINTYQNTSQLPIGGYTGIVNNNINTNVTQSVSGIQGFKFPVSNTPTPTITANLTNLT